MGSLFLPGLMIRDSEKQLYQFDDFQMFGGEMALRQGNQ